MISFDEAQNCYRESLQSLPTETIPTVEALGRVLHTRALSTVDLPRFDQSAMDGYACIAAEAVAPMPICGRAEAGGTPAQLQAGACVRILTGAAVPPQADTVIPQEQVEVRGNLVIPMAPVQPRAHIRKRAEELSVGTMVLSAGERLNPGRIASLCMAGVGRVQVVRQPRVAVLVTGDELRAAGDNLGDAQVFDANGPMVQSYLAQRGLQAVLVEYVADTPEAVDAALSRALAVADVIVTTGGASVGDRDYLPAAAERVGFKRQFWKVAQKPGKPLLFASQGAKCLLALPGNPAAVLIGLYLHLNTVLNALEGLNDPGPQWMSAFWDTPPRADTARERFVRARLITGEDGRTQLQKLPGQASHMLVNMAHADALVRVRAGEARSRAEYILLR